jgi:hypothetical protein
MEDFSSLENWEALEFPDIERNTTYRLRESDESAAGGSVLVAEADASASGLIHRRTFDVYETPYVEWRWRTEGTVPGGDAATKEGDDYACRIYIVFPYDPDEVGFGERMKYRTAKLLYGEFPPLASLNYIWANTDHLREVIPNAFTPRAKMLPVESGSARAGQWRSYRRDIREDYRKAYGEEPPQNASIAIMTDTDNTGERAVSYYDYVRVVGE